VTVQDTISSSVANRVSQKLSRLALKPAKSWVNFGEAPPVADPYAPRAAQVDRDHKSDIRRSQVGRHLVERKHARPAALFAQEVTPDEITKIEHSEAIVRELQARMSQVENQILEAIPSSDADAIAKLRFVSTIIRDGEEIEIDYLASLVEECTELLEMNRKAGVG
jgi:hypothetical protein